MAKKIALYEGSKTRNEKDAKLRENGKLAGVRGVHGRGISSILYLNGSMERGMEGCLDA